MVFGFVVAGVQALEPVTYFQYAFRTKLLSTATNQEQAEVDLRQGSVSRAFSFRCLEKTASTYSERSCDVVIEACTQLYWAIVQSLSRLLGQICPSNRNSLDGFDGGCNVATQLKLGEGFDQGCVVTNDAPSTCFVSLELID